MTTLYPEIEPYDSGLLAVGAGHQIYWEAFQLTFARILTHYFHHQPGWRMAFYCNRQTS